MFSTLYGTNLTNRVGVVCAFFSGIAFAFLSRLTHFAHFSSHALRAFLLFVTDIVSELTATLVLQTVFSTTGNELDESPKRMRP